MEYPKFINGEPPTISLSEYDDSEWAKDTAVDFNKEKNCFVVVLMEDPTKIIAKFDKNSEIILEDIFKSAKQQYVEQS